MYKVKYKILNLWGKVLNFTLNFIQKLHKNFLSDLAALGQNLAVFANSSEIQNIYMGWEHHSEFGINARSCAHRFQVTYELT